MANTTRNPPPAKLTRRQLVERLLTAVAAGAVWPAIAAAHPIHQHLMNGELLDRADSLHEADWTPLFLSIEQNAALLPLAESLLPGATSAEVNRFIDLLLSVESPENQRKFGASLAALEKAANDHFTGGLARLTHTQYEVLLTALSAPDAPQRGHFDYLKEWITGAYYSSETGMRELGWTGNFAFPAYPQCETPRSAA